MDHDEDYSYIMPGTVRARVSTGVNVINPVQTDTKANWDAKKDLVAKKGYLYVYSDYDTDENGNPIPGIKVGDGKSYLIDTPFMSGNITVLQHQMKSLGSVTDAEKEFWNNKVTAFVPIGDGETLILSKLPEEDYKGE